MTFLGISSASWTKQEFPNPQAFVPNIFNAKPSDYQKATQRIWHTPEDASFIGLPVVPTE